MTTVEEVSIVWLSLKVAAASVAASLPFAIGAALLLARVRFPGKTLVDALIHLPLVLPPVLTGYILLVLFGRHGAIGARLQEWFGVSVAFRWTGAVIAAGVATTTALPRVRTAMAERDLPENAARWLALEIPAGTVWAEETVFRGALHTLAVRAVGPALGRLLQAIAFGLWHIPDARKEGESILGTVLVTGLAGWAFGWLAERSGSLLAPMLAHLAINEAGAVAALAVNRKG